MEYACLLSQLFPWQAGCLEEGGAGNLKGGGGEKGYQFFFPLCFYCVCFAPVGSLFFLNKENLGIGHAGQEFRNMI